MTEIRTLRLTVRNTVAADWRDIREIWADFGKSEFAKYDIPHSTDEKEVRERIVRWEKANDSVEHQFFSVCLGEKVIGYASFNKHEDGYELGYAFSSEFHGKGYAKESISALLDFFKNRGVKRIFAGTALNNTPSVKLLSALGFEMTGTEKVSFYKDENGQPIFFDGGAFELKL